MYEIHYEYAGAIKRPLKRRGLCPSVSVVLIDRSYVCSWGDGSVPLHSKLPFLPHDLRLSGK